MVNATPQATTGQQDGRAVLLQLLAEVARGNKSAFARIYGLTHAKLLGVGLRILRDRALAEDVLQESYLKVWRHAASYDPSIASPMTWMATIVRHGAIDALRKRQIEAFAGDDEALAAFARLPEDKRRLIMLAYLRDRSRHELSVRLGIPANTIKTHLRRALLEMRATMLASIDARAHEAA